MLFKYNYISTILHSLRRHPPSRTIKLGQHPFHLKFAECLTIGVVATMRPLSSYEPVSKIANKPILKRCNISNDSLAETQINSQAIMK
jgi:hypothetical protein